MFKRDRHPSTPSAAQMHEEAIRSRAMQLGKRSLMIQRGYFATRAEWRQRREEHQECLRHIDRWLRRKRAAES